MTVHGVRPELAALLVPIEDLTPHPANPNDGDADAIAESLQVNGMYRPIVVWRQPGPPHVILAGNTTYAAAASLGWSHVAATWVDADDAADAWRILAADNRYAQLARMNEPALVAGLQALPDLAGTGYTDADVAGILAGLDRAASNPISVDDWAPDRAGAGLREALLVLPAADHAELMRLFARIRDVVGQHPQGVVALRAARVAAAVLDGGSGHPRGCPCVWCQVARQAGVASLLTDPDPTT